MNCIFCNQIEKEQILFETRHFKAVYDIDPIQFGHVLVMTREHKIHINELSQQELNELIVIQKQVIGVMEHTLLIAGVSVVMNNGEILDAGTHFHIHLVPRYQGDDFWTHQQVVEKPIDLHALHSNLKKGVHV